MKLLIFILFYLAISLYSKELPVMLKVNSNFNLGNNVIDTFRSGAEDSLTSQGYLLISKEQQELALREQAEQRDSDCYDDACLVDTGKMMAAQMIFIITITKMKKDYIFKVRLVDLETGSTKKTVTDVYTKRLSSAIDLLKFSKKLTNRALGIDKEKEKLKLKEEREKNSNYINKNRTTIELANLIEIVVNSEPSGATVYFDGKFAGKTPTSIKMVKGKHKFKLTMKNFEDYSFEREYYINKNENIKLDTKYYKIYIKTVPDRAKVFYENKSKGFSTIELSIPESDFNKSKEIKITKKGYYDKIIKLNTETPEELTLMVELETIPQYVININYLQKDIMIEKTEGDCRIKERNNIISIIGYKDSECTLKFSKKYSNDKSIRVTFKKNEIMDIFLKKFDSYQLKFVLDKDTKIVVINSRTNDKFNLYSGVTKELPEGNYSYEIVKDGFAKIFDNFLLNEDKIIKKEMIAVSNEYLTPYINFNLNLSSSFLFSSLGLGVELLRAQEGMMIFSLGGAINFNFTDSYLYNNIYGEVKLNVIDNLNLGGGAIIIKDNVGTSILVSLVADYRYFIDNFFIKAKLTSGISYSVNEDGKIFFIMSGIYLGWNIF